MTREEFKELTRNTLFLDGATGSNMMAAGMPKGTCTEQWIYENKEILLDLQRAYVDAGSNIIYAPTFGANRITLRGYGLENRITELNTALVAYAREAAGGKAYVAGDVTTTGQVIGYSSGYSYTKAYDNYCEQIQILAEAGTDLIVAETMMSVDETIAALDACANVCDLPIMCTASINGDGSMFFGGNIIDSAPDLVAAGAMAVGINCSVGPEQLDAVVKNIRKAVNVPVIVKPNAGIPEIDENGVAVYGLSPEDFAAKMKELHQLGATILGGCCGTAPNYIRAMVNAIAQQRD